MLFIQKKYYICSCNVVRHVTKRKYYKNPIRKASLTPANLMGFYFLTKQFIGILKPLLLWQNLN